MKRHDIICALLGVTFGTCVGVLATREYYKQKYALEADRAMEEYKEYWEEKLEKTAVKAPRRPSEPLDDQEVLDTVKAFTEPLRASEACLEGDTVSYKADYEKRQPVDYTQYKKPDLAAIAAKYKDTDLDAHLAEREHPEEYDEETDELIEDGRLADPNPEPYLISPEEYMDPDSEALFEKHEIMWFTDGEFADDHEEILDNFDRVLERLDFDFETDWDHIYVRNEMWGIDYDIENMGKGYNEYLVDKYGS